VVLSLNPPRELRWWLSAGGLKNVRLEPVAGAGSAADVSAVRSGFLSGSRLAAGWAVRRGDRSGLVRPVRGWPAGGFEQVHPLVLAVPVFWEIHGEGPRPWRAVRAAMLMRSARRVARRALAYVRLARAPAARSS